MNFTTITALDLPTDAVSRGFLISDPWDDLFSFDTRYRLIIFDENGTRHSPGTLKIGRAGLKAASVTMAGDLMTRVPVLPTSFENLEDHFFFDRAGR